MESASTISIFQSLILGIVEGITEYLPISSTGHLVIVSDLLGLQSSQTHTPAQIEAIQAFEIVIQSGAILAVVFLYWRYVRDMMLGILGRSNSGRKLAINVACATMPILVTGFCLKGLVSKYLQFSGPVIFAMALGGIAMILFERLKGKHSSPAGALDIADLTWKQALAIGFFQCLAIWPGTSRSMVTIIGGMFIGLRRPSSAEFSFLIGLPALLAATIFKAHHSGRIIIDNIGVTSLAVGFFTSLVFAMISVKWLVAFLNKHGLSLFGWYRLVVAIILFLLIGV